MRIAVLPFAVLSLAAGPLAGQTERGAFVVTLGKDTIVVEQYTRTRTTLEGDMLVRAAAVIQRHYTGSLKADGSMARFESTNRNLSNPQAPAVHYVVTFGDTTVVDVTRDTTHNQVKVATPNGALPFLNFSYAMYEQYGRRAQATARDTVATLPMGANSLTMLVVHHPARDSLNVAFAGDAPTLFRVDPSGLIQAVDGRFTTQKVLSTRLAALDFNALAAAFATRPLGQLSPTDVPRCAAARCSAPRARRRAPSSRGTRCGAPARTSPHGSPAPPTSSWPARRFPPGRIRSGPCPRPPAGS